MIEPGAIPATDPEEERHRDPAAVNDFLERTHRSVFAMACRLTHDPEHRQDWTHDVLLHLVEELGRGRFVYRWPGCFWSWFAMRARFLLLNRLRRYRLQEGRFESGPLAEKDLAAVALPTSVSPDRVMQGLQARETVEECIDKLDRDEVQVTLVYPGTGQRRAATYDRSTGLLDRNPELADMFSKDNWRW